MSVFELSDMAEIVGMPISKAKNWTFGRPLRITPSVRAEQGQGSRNLYNVGDIYRMSLAHECNKAGMPPKLLVQLLEQVGMQLETAQWLRAWREGKGKLRVQLSREDPPEGVLVWQTVKLDALRKRINTRINS